MRNLADGLQALQSAIAAYGTNEDISVFDSVVSKGLSGDEIDAAFAPIEHQIMMATAEETDHLIQHARAK